MNGGSLNSWFTYFFRGAVLFSLHHVCCRLWCFTDVSWPMTKRITAYNT
ncbi:hypothetical protein V6Z11_D09G000100 [Gossypium hirsutum]